VPVYQSTPRPIYILHTPNIKLPRSAEVLHSKLKWVRDFDSSTQSPGHTVNYNGSVTLIHPFQSHGPVVRKICQSNTTRLWQGCTDRSLWQGRSDKVALTRSLWQGHSDKVALTRSLWQGRSDKVALTRSLWLLRGFLIPIINTTFIELSTTAYLRLLFLSSSYPKTQPLVPLLQERPIYNGSKDHLLDKRKRRRYVWWLLLGELLKG